MTRRYLSMQKPLRITFPRMLSEPRKASSFVYATLLVFYAVCALLFFIFWLAPSLDGRSPLHIAADSAAYVHIADGLKKGTVDPWIASLLVRFPNGLWSPVFVALISPSLYVMALINCALFAVSVYMLQKAYKLSLTLFLVLLLMNSTTAISLLAVNKEMVDFFCVAAFLYARQTRSPWLTVMSIIIAALNRYEVAVCIVLFTFLTSRYGPFALRRGCRLLALLACITLATPVLSTNLVAQLGDVESRTLVVLNYFEGHYLYFLVAIPKIFLNLFGQLFSILSLNAAAPTDRPIVYVAWLNNLANVILLAIAFRKKTLTIQSDIVYFAAMSCLVIAAGVIVQPRYFYYVYALLCLELSRPLPEQSYKIKVLPVLREDIQHERC